MKRRYRFAYIVVAIVLMAGAAMPRVRTKQRDKVQRHSSTASQPGQPSAVTAAAASVTGSGTAGQLVKFAVDGSVVVNSNVTETKLGNVGIGTTTPDSKLSVQGMIETMLGGYKFPDGTIQTSASSGKVEHDGTLKGDGSTATPLGLAAPLLFTGSAFRNQQALLVVNNIAARGLGIIAFGGAADSNGQGGLGLQAQGGNGTANTGGDGLLGAGGVGINHDGGAGGRFFGAFGNNGSGGDGLVVSAGAGSGAGHKGGRGLVAFAGAGEDGATTGLAGEFQGNVAITGNLSKGGGSFKIDHPLDPENKYLYHSFVESPDMMNIYNGTVTTDANGDAAVTLPDWFEALNQDFRYQLTVIGTFAQAIVAEKVKGNRFTVKTNAPNVEVSWQVTGIRHDAYANKHRIPLEEQKPEEERGLFLHPDAFNKSEDKGVQFVRNAAQIERLNSTRERARQQSQQR